MNKYYKSFEINESRYPVVLIPNGIREIIKLEIPNEAIQEQLGLNYPIANYLQVPNKPRQTRSVQREKLKFKGDGCGLIIALPTLILIILVIYASLKEGGGLVFLIMLGVLFYFLNELGVRIKSEKYYISENIPDEEYQTLLKKYEIEHLNIIEKNRVLKEALENKILEIDIEVEQKFDEYSRKIYCQKLQSLTELKKLRTVGKKGRTELFFLKFLIDKFGKQIIVDGIPIINKYEYQPDFVFICEETGFHIDIEIDEPYNSINGLPIHNDRTYEELRNQYFDRINWGIIKFSESQIAEYPKLCIELIENVITSIRKKEINYHYNFPEVNFWTYEQALIMANNNYRNSYLPSQLRLTDVDFNLNISDIEDNLPF